jgi:hypothetical protein
MVKDKNYFLNELSTIEVSPTTKKTYAYNLAWMATRMDEWETGTPDSEQVIGYMTDNNVGMARRMNSYTAMKVLHNCRNEPESSEHYKVPLTDCKKCVDIEYCKQRKTARQRKNWVEFSCLKKFTKQLREQAYALDKNRPWTKDEFAALQLGFILQVHMSFPIRRDLCTLLWGEGAADEANNYIDETKRELVWNKHKVAKHYGQIKHKLSREMWKLFTLIRKQQKMRDIQSGTVLLNRYWRPLTKNGYSSWLVREMKNCPGCEDKCIGVLILRHSIITHKTRHMPTLEQRDEFSRSCMHSAHMNDLYRVH